jgi:FkbM family methyltransferase
MNVVRTAAERLSRGVVLARRLPSEFGGAKLFVAPASGGLRYWRLDMGKIDVALLRFVARYVEPGTRVWDVGANVGLFSFAAAFCAGPTGRVVAIEPDVDCATLLLRTRREIDRSRYADVDVVVGAVCAAGRRFGRLTIAKRARSANALDGFGSSQTGGALEARTVLTTSLDELRTEFGHPDVVKIDVEGAEAEVLRGAETTLAERRPILHVEVSGEMSREVGSILRRHGYRFFDAEAASPEDAETEQPAWNCLALPSRA